MTRKGAPEDHVIRRSWPAQQAASSCSNLPLFAEGVKSCLHEVPHWPAWMQTNVAHRPWIEAQMMPHLVSLFYISDRADLAVKRPFWVALGTVIVILVDIRPTPKSVTFFGHILKFSHKNIPSVPGQKFLLVHLAVLPTLLREIIRVSLSFFLHLFSAFSRFCY